MTLGDKALLSTEFSRDASLSFSLLKTEQEISAFGPSLALRTVRWTVIWSWEAGWEVMTVGSVIIVITALSSRQQEVTHRLHSEACQDLPARIPSFQGLVIPRSLEAWGHSTEGRRRYQIWRTRVSSGESGAAAIAGSRQEAWSRLLGAVTISWGDGNSFRGVEERARAWAWRTPLCGEPI